MTDPNVQYGYLDNLKIAQRHLNVVWGRTLIHMPRAGETLRDYYFRIHELKVRANGELDMRYRTSRAIAKQESQS